MTRLHESPVLSPFASEPLPAPPPWLPAPPTPLAPSPSEDAPAADWSMLARAFDALGQGLLICHRSGRWQSNAAYRTLASASPHGARIRAGSHSLGRWLLAAGAPTTRRPPQSRVVHIRTGRNRYQLRGTRMPAIRSKDAVVLVTVVRWPVEVAEPALLRRRFGLTPQQAQVARLLAERRTNKEIARQLSISPHTAKRHTEQVLLKLGVASRRSVGELVRSLATGSPRCTGAARAAQ